MVSISWKGQGCTQKYEVELRKRGIGEALPWRMEARPMSEEEPRVRHSGSSMEMQLSATLAGCSRLTSAGRTSPEAGLRRPPEALQILQNVKEQRTAPPYDSSGQSETIPHNLYYTKLWISVKGLPRILPKVDWPCCHLRYDWRTPQKTREIKVAGTVRPKLQASESGYEGPAAWATGRTANVCPVLLLRGRAAPLEIARFRGLDSGFERGDRSRRRFLGRRVRLLVGSGMGFLSFPVLQFGPWHRNCTCLATVRLLSRPTMSVSRYAIAACALGGSFSPKVRGLQSAHSSCKLQDCLPRTKQRNRDDMKKNKTGNVPKPHAGACNWDGRRTAQSAAASL
jgi:hypothetical protein